ncbi:MAG: hypothetical protein V1789_05705 [PVC group bacterium]
MMARKFLMVGLIGMAAGIIAACSSVDVTSDLHDQQLTETGATSLAHIHSDIWGIYFLGFESCPVITGSYREPGSYHFFRHTVSPGTAAGMVTGKSRELGAAKTIDLTTDWYSGWQTYTLIFWLKEAQASGNALIEEDPSPSAALTAETKIAEEE